MQDVERIESLTLDDYVADFSRVDIPSEDRPMTVEEFQRALHSFLHVAGVPVTGNVTGAAADRTESGAGGAARADAHRARLGDHHAVQDA